MLCMGNIKKNILLLFDVCLELQKSLGCCIQGLIRLAERKARKVLGQNLVGLGVKLGRWDRTDANLLCQPVAGSEILRAIPQQIRELVILRHLDLVRVHKDEVRSFGDGAGQTQLAEDIEQLLALVLVRLDLASKEPTLICLFESNSNGLLKGRVDAEDDTGVGSQSGLNQSLGSDQPTNTPACRSKSLSTTSDSDCALPESIQSSNALMLHRVKVQAIVLADTKE